MGWPYGFPSLTDDEKLQRRHTLDLYACIAHFSAFAPALLFLLFRLVRHQAARSGLGARRAAAAAGEAGAEADDRGRYAQVPHSPIVKAHRRAPAGQLAARWRALLWSLQHDVRFAGAHWGQRHEWLVGLVWTAWLLALCIMGTQNDYFHLTKRFGTVAVSQLPIQYLMALKPLNPFAWAFGSSHEQVNRFHRVLGRIIYALLIIHILLYNAYFLRAGIWFKRFFAPIVFAGVVSSLAMHAIVATSSAAARKYSYRLFFITHMAASSLIPVLIFFHAPSARLYIVEAVAIFIIGVTVRSLTTVQTSSSLEVIPGTNLVKISATVPRRKLASFSAFPGMHVYLAIPPGSRSSANLASNSAVLDMLSNPFTVAAVNDEDGSIMLVARTRQGPMTTALHQLASSTHSSASDPCKIPLAIEGPYGSMGKHFRSLLDWGPARILIITGGVGATFALPVYQAIRQESPAAKTQLIWAVRSAADTAWVPDSSADGGKNILEDEHVQIFLTADTSVDLAPGEHGAGRGAMEMDALPRAGNRGRPDVEKIVNDTFRKGFEEPIAIIVCGPNEMAAKAKQCVTSWAIKGRNIWWHNETFGW